jgi:hypothetical protein
MDHMGDEGTRGSKGGLGDDQGTRIGSPDARIRPAQHSDTPPDRPERKLGVGSEPTEALHSAQGDNRDEEALSGLSGQETGRSDREGTERVGSEPLEERENEHRSGYGGAGGTPVESSDERL